MDLSGGSRNNKTKYTTPENREGRSNEGSKLVHQRDIKSVRAELVRDGRIKKYCRMMMESDRWRLMCPVTEIFLVEDKHVVFSDDDRDDCASHFSTSRTDWSAMDARRISCARMHLGHQLKLSRIEDKNLGSVLRRGGIRLGTRCTTGRP
ncbi:hypothetical protein EI94DRAFT_666402 [Lactarius quietus]|nr:hypothetical protein EI94DRAFT_666402 [Lactarius quietus]